MSEAKKCPDCKVDMEEGFAPDFAFNAVIQMMWHPGKPESKTVLGVRTGSLKLDQSDVFNFVRYGHTFYAQGKYDEAKKAYIDGLRHHPSNRTPIVQVATPMKSRRPSGGLPD